MGVFLNPVGKEGNQDFSANARRSRFVVELLPEIQQLRPRQGPYFGDLVRDL